MIIPRMRRVNGWWGVALHSVPYKRFSKYRQLYEQAQKHAARLNLWTRAGRAAGLAGPLRCPEGTTHIVVGDTGVLFYKWAVTHHVDASVGPNIYGWFWWNPDAWSFNGPGLGRWSLQFSESVATDRVVRL